MAEFCLKCWNEMNHTSLKERDVVISDDLDFCEGCGEMRRVVDGYKEPSLFWKYLRRVFRV